MVLGRRERTMWFWGEERGPLGFGEGEEYNGFGGGERGPLSFGVLLVATQLRQQERLCLEEKG